MLIGTAFALLAGLLWGLVFVAPQWLPEYPAALLSAGRYLAFGLIALPLAWLDRARLAQLTAADWQAAAALSLVGNLLYYLCLAAALQRAGGPLPTMIIGTLPVVIAVVSNRRDAWRDGRMPWRRLLLPLLLIATGIGLVNHDELARLREASGTVPWADYLWGSVLALGAVACWTWYPIHNADWLRHGVRPRGAALGPAGAVDANAGGGTDSSTRVDSRNPRTWATAQGLVTLPMALLAVLGFWAWSALSGSSFPMPLGPTPQRFVLTMLAIGLLASWLGTTFWNEASQRLPTTLAGQLIVFETLAALAYAFALRGAWPPPATAAGIVLLVAGVVVALRVKPQA